VESCTQLAFVGAWDDYLVMNSLRGSLLIAHGLVDPNFRHVVILLLEHSDQGALGVVLNRPSETSVRDGAPKLRELVPERESVFLGGPVQPDVALVLADHSAPDFGEPVVGSIGLLEDLSDPEALSGIRRVRVFAGYAGWSPLQLEAELEREDWIVESANPDDVLTENPKDLWSTLLRRRGGKYAVLALMPFDPSTN
jgi:putative transcriptional regulator